MARLPAGDGLKEGEHPVGRLADRLEGVGVAGHVDGAARAGCQLGNVVLRHEGPPRVSESASMLRRVWMKTKQVEVS